MPGEKRKAKAARVAARGKKETEVSGRCAFCRRKCGESDFCYGCRRHVCEKCNVNYELMGFHEVRQHKDEVQD